MCYRLYINIRHNVIPISDVLNRMRAGSIKDTMPLGGMVGSLSGIRLAEELTVNSVGRGSNPRRSFLLTKKD